MYRLIQQRLFSLNQKTVVLSHTCIKQQIQWASRVEKNTVSNIKKYWFDKYIDYIKNYDHVFEKNFPKTMHVYRIFSIGTKDFTQDVKNYVLILKKQSVDGVDTLTTDELRLTHTVPKDFSKICPVLLLSALPFTNYIIFPLAYYFPRYLLTSHYWTLQQKLDFMLSDHKRRLRHNRPLFRCMQAELQNIKSQSLRLKWSGIMACLGSGTHPNVNDVIACSELFANQPFSLNSLKRKHINELLGIHDMSSWRPFKKKKLIERGMLIKQMDQAIQREGGINEMSNEAMRWALSFRGVNPANMSLESMKNWLEQWFVISNTVNENTISLLLHSPVLLAYNHPTNWTLVYG
ncbi:LETM1 domain-containing protein 1 isoform X2 [Ceratina calcarata]|uniref:LETM1 domain-containing protein 1 isoform X1 n=1 Tax=Ceratina calcarata TaxID=156304 RepID=A0AAJ7JAL1_9HYME|nr:LETM1 domain-containing protein 1 isoform X1 [Ceratina calcarata]XP_017888945.1 LETM1 domain-containing protein 1 isoform X2 [Ceratina calcarata]